MTNPFQTLQNTIDGLSSLTNEERKTYLDQLTSDYVEVVGYYTSLIADISEKPLTE